MRPRVDLWIDLRSPYSFLAKDPAHALESDFDVELRLIVREAVRSAPHVRACADFFAAEIQVMRSELAGEPIPQPS